jgi:hypothetical protein
VLLTAAAKAAFVQLDLVKKTAIQLMRIFLAATQGYAAERKLLFVHFVPASLEYLCKLQGYQS